jgi:hypothetical protein
MERTGRRMNTVWKRPSNNLVSDLSRVIHPRRDDLLEDLLVEDESGRIWFLNTVGNVDPRRSPRARFVYLLGAPFVNVAEVQLLEESSAEVLRELGLPKATDRCFVVRVVENYATDELPCRTVDSATAGELVFSLWIRRRDAHAENRGYNPDGIPVFFDFDLACCMDGRSTELQDFFSHTGPGDAGTWRVQEAMPEQIPISTEIARRVGHNTGVHLIQSISGFEAEAHSIARAIAGDNRNFNEIAVKAGLSDYEAPRFLSLLEQTRGSLLQDTEAMLDVVLRRVSGGAT